MLHPFNAATLPELLQAYAALQPDHPAYTFLPVSQPDDLSAESLSYRQLHARAAAIAAALQKACPAGERALLLYPSGLEYICAFLGCLAAGVIAVPAYPPSLRRPDERIQAMAADCHPALVLTTAEILAERPSYLRHLPLLESIPWLATESIPAASGGSLPLPPDPQAAAFLQYTSGSTRQPRGVMVRHANLLANHAAFKQAMGLERDVAVCWLPLHHDMGLIGNVLQTLYHGATCVLMPSLAFLQNPLSWLKTISTYRAQASGGPNFAYELCLRIPLEQRRGLDLSCWQVAIIGAEPIHPETLRRFRQEFEPFGFQARAFFPSYGLAEATVFVSGAPLTAERAGRKFNRQALAAGLVQPAANAGDPNSVQVTPCGSPGLEMELRIVNPQSCQLCLPDQVGEIWLRGPSVTAGYWQRPAETAETFQAQIGGAGPAYLRTGDLGFLDQGELFITGRLKEVLIFNGLNYYPLDLLHSLEKIALLADGLAQGGGSAFELPGPDGPNQRGRRLALALELKKSRLEALTPSDFERLCAAVRSAIAADHQLNLDTIYFVAPGSIPRTSSGKIRHNDCGARLQSGELIPLASQTRPLEGAAAETAPTQDLQAYLHARLAALLGCAPDQLGPQTRLSDLGFKFEHAARLRQTLLAELKLETTPTLAFDYPTLAGLAGYLQKRLAEETNPPPAETAPGDLDQLSADELATRLAEKLRQS